MATIGLRRPYYSVYTYDDATNSVEYNGAKVLAKAIQLSTTFDTATDNNLYADDGIAETDNTFSGGTLSITTDDLTLEASAAILGITPSTIVVDGESVTELVYGDAMNTPDLGFGVIVTKKHHGQQLYRAVVFNKIKFAVPEEAATTKGESIEWQTPTLEATIMRDDTTARAWKREATFDTEEEARAYIEAIFAVA